VAAPPQDDIARWTHLLRSERLPAAIVDLDAFDRNLATFTAPLLGSGKTLRPATKSLRCRALLERVRARAPELCRGLLAYAPREACWLAEQGWDDVVVAYPTALPQDWALYARVSAAGRRVTPIVDDPRHVALAEAAAREHGTTLPLAIELDVSWRPWAGAIHVGARRSPIRTVEALVSLARRIADSPHLRFDGVMGYDAHIAGVPDRVPGEVVGNLLKRWMKGRAWPAAVRLRTAARDALTSAGLPPRFFNGGGSGSLVRSLSDPSLTEVTAGSGFVDSHIFDRYVEMDLEPAIFFALQVVRRSDPGLVTCQAGGYIASGATGGDRSPIPWSPPGLRLTGAEGAGEVQTPLRLPPGVELEIGDPIVFRHAKAGELAEHAQSYLLVSGGEVVERVPTYRGEGWLFP
jgi:D-serine deaminase-like pyridoxal phosphate-dependent protein